jgi:cytochrome P450
MTSRRIETIAAHISRSDQDLDSSLSKSSTANVTAAASQHKKVGSTDEGAFVAKGLGGSAEEDPYAIEGVFVDLDKLGLPMVGTDADLADDYVAGLNAMATKVDPKTKMGFVDTIESGHILLCTHPKSVTKVLTTSVQHFLGGLRPPSAAFFGPKILFMLEGREWLDLRNVLKKAFQKHTVGLMAEDTHDALDKLNQILEKYSQSEQDLDFMRLIGCYHLQAIGQVAFHTDIKVLENFEDGNVIEQSFEYLLEELPRRAYATDFEVQNDFESDNADNRMMAEMSYQVRNVIRQIISKRLADLEAGVETPKDLLEAMISVFVEQYPEAKGDVEMLTVELGDNFVEIMFAGYTTAVPTTCHAFFFLSQRPDLMDRVCEEVDRVLQGRRPTQDDLAKLVFCERVIMETLRLCPPASLIARQTTRDLVLEGVPIPKATRVWMPACYIQRDPDFWEEPNAFDPDRFEKKPVRGSYIPFSDGARNCAGRNFAMWESVCALATLFARFRVQAARDYDWKTIFTGFGLRPFDLTEARVCMRLRVVPRE